MNLEKWLEEIIHILKKKIIRRSVIESEFSNMLRIILFERRLTVAEREQCVKVEMLLNKLLK